MLCVCVCVCVCVCEGGGVQGVHLSVFILCAHQRERRQPHKEQWCQRRQLIDVNLLSVFTFEASEQSARNRKCFIRVFLLILL